MDGQLAVIGGMRFGGADFKILWMGICGHHGMVIRMICSGTGNPMEISIMLINPASCRTINNYIK